MKTICSIRLLEAIKFINFCDNIKLEGATMNSMSNVRGRMGSMRLPMSLKGVV
jgi:hypothetical protein